MAYVRTANNPEPHLINADSPLTDEIYFCDEDDIKKPVEAGISQLFPVPSPLLASTKEQCEEASGEPDTSDPSNDCGYTNN